MTTRALSLLLLAALLFFVALGNHQLQDSTEPRVAGIAMEMHLSDNWVTPMLNGQAFLEKPPLSVWLDASAIRLFGAEPWAVRLASAFAGSFSVWLLYIMLRRLDRPAGVAWTAAFMLATTAGFWSNSRQVGEDALLSLGVTMALLAFFRASQLATEKRSARAAWLLFSLGIVISTLSKGVLGLAMPGVVIFAWLLCDTLRQRRLTPIDWLRPALFTLLALIPLLVWLVFLYGQGGTQSLTEVLWTNSVGRFSGSFEEAGHYEPFYYYLGKLPEAFLPWNLLVYVGLWHFRRQLFANRHLLFFSLWLGAQFLLLSLASSKRTVYLMSLAPAAAVIAAEFAVVLCAALQARREHSTLAAFALRYGRVLLIGGVVLLVSGYLSAAMWLVPRADRQLSFLPLTDKVHALQAQGRHVVLFQPSERLAGASVFYTRSLLDTINSDSELKRWLADTAGGVAIIESLSPPEWPLAVIDHFKIGDRVYYLVTHDMATADQKSNVQDF
ncbi:ArnT family glycosyltransferase [Pseudomonas sp. NPDC090202]|uniref:ArnT family glycosyltransferase n=1 Tax=unclassified Pseudomonas TaxID=196821 RepID=UPI0037F2D1B5